MNNTAMGALLLGLGLLVLAELAPRLPRASWTNERAARLQMASQNYHAALHHAAHRQATAEGAPLEEARQEFEKHQAMLASLQARGENLRRALRWLGVAACGIGLVLHLWVRFQSPGP
jgi:hypothetical protein